MEGSAQALVKRHFQPLAAKAGVHVDNWHSLRHFAVSTWIEAGFSPKTVQTFAGHSALEVTMSRYGHLFKDTAHQAAMNRIADELAAKMQRIGKNETLNGISHHTHNLKVAGSNPAPQPELI